MTSTYRVPQDIAYVYMFLTGDIVLDFSDCLVEEIRDWKRDVSQARKAWAAGGPEPDWDAYREQLNEACEDDGSQPFFPEIAA